MDWPGLVECDGMEMFYRCDSVGLERCFVVGGPEVHFPSRVIPKDFKKWYSQLPCLVISTRDSVESKPASLLVVFVGKALNGMSPSLCGKAGGGAKQSAVVVA